MNEFRTGKFDIITYANEPNFDNVPSGVLWVPDLDTWRISTASGVREIRTGHGLFQAFRSTSATAQTFINNFADMLMDQNPIIDEQYYTWDGSGTLTIKHTGIYSIAYNTTIDLNLGIATSSLSTIKINGTTTSSLPQIFGVHTTDGPDSNGKRFLLTVTIPNTTLVIAAIRIAGIGTLEFGIGGQLNVERISPLRNPTSPGSNSEGD